MTTNSKWNQFASYSAISQSIDFDLTPTIIKQRSNHDPNSLLTLSNYLQHDDSSMYCHDKYQGNHKENQLILKRSLLLISDYNQDQEKSQFIKTYEIQDQESQSMLLLDSEIKYHNQEISETCLLSKSRTQLMQEINRSNPNTDETKQSIFLRLYENDQKKNIKNCSDSFQFMNLLSIPKETQLSQQREVINSANKKDDQLEKMKAIIESLTQKINQRENSCPKCVENQNRIKTLQQYLSSKQKEISKYQKLIDQLNQKVFDFKIQNKRLTFQNQKYQQQLLTFLSKKTKIISKQKLNTIGYESSQECSFFEGVTEDFHKFTTGSRTLTQLEQLNKKHSLKQTKFKEQDSIKSPSKAYPQTPLPTVTYLKPKKQRKQSNYSDYSVQISISKVKEPSFQQIPQIKNGKIANQNKNECIQNRKQIKVHSQQNIKRFSDLLKQAKNLKPDKSRDKLQTQKANFVALKQICPSKNYDFSKTKESQSFINKNLKQIPLHKINVEQDKFSQFSETKTEKFQYGAKSRYRQIKVQENDSILMNRNFRKGLQNVYGKVQQKSRRKDQVTYKTFKQIGSFNQVKESSQNCRQMENQTVFLCKQEYGVKSNAKNYQNLNLNFDKKQRRYVSPNPILTRKQNTERSNISNSPNTQSVSRQTETKPFLR